MSLATRTTKACVLRRDTPASSFVPLRHGVLGDDVYAMHVILCSEIIARILVPAAEHSCCPGDNFL